MKFIYLIFLFFLSTESHSYEKFYKQYFDKIDNNKYNLYAKKTNEEKFYYIHYIPVIDSFKSKQNTGYINIQNFLFYEIKLLNKPDPIELKIRNIYGEYRFEKIFFDNNYIKWKRNPDDYEIYLSNDFKIKPDSYKIKKEFKNDFNYLSIDLSSYYRIKLEKADLYYKRPKLDIPLITNDSHHYKKINDFVFIKNYFVFNKDDKYLLILSFILMIIFFTNLNSYIKTILLLLISSIFIYFKEIEFLFYTLLIFIYLFNVKAYYYFFFTFITLLNFFYNYPILSNFNNSLDYTFLKNYKFDNFSTVFLLNLILLFSFLIINSTDKKKF